MSESEFRLSAPNGAPLRDFAPSLAGFVALDSQRSVNTIGITTLTLAADTIPWSFFSRDTRLEHWRAAGTGALALETETLWLLRRRRKLRDLNGARTVELRFHDLNDLLNIRDIAYPASSAQSAKSGPADDLMKALVRENLGALAIDANRSLELLTVAPDLSQAPTVELRFARRRLLSVLLDLAAVSTRKGTPLFFDLVWTGESIEFRTYTQTRGIDRSASVVLSPEFDNLATVELEDDWSDEATVIYAVGRGLLDLRAVEQAQDAGRIGQSPFGWRERTIDARDLVTNTALQARAEAALHAGVPLHQFAGVVKDNGDYGVRWRFGDIVRSEYEGEVQACRIDGRRIQIQQGGAEMLAVELAVVGSRRGAERYPSLNFFADQSVATEAPEVGETPAPHAVPQAGATGTLADGWLAASIARTLDVASEAAARAASDQALSNSIAAEINARAAADTAEAGLRAAADTAEATARAAADSSEASTRAAADTAEASARTTHEALTTTAHGGIIASSDVTTTPTASKVPRAVTGTTIADGWLSAAIARTSDVTAEATARASADSAHAALTTSAHGGIVASTDARLSDARTPTTHAATHQHGGGDEIATATPAANVIPKTGAGGNLDSWISTALARIASANNWTVAQTFVPTHSTATNTLTVMSYNVLASGVTPAAGFGQDHVFNASSDTQNRNQHLQRTSWVSAVDASRKARTIFYTFDTAAREAFRIEASGTTPMIGFLGAAAVVRQVVAALTVSVGTSDGTVADVGAVFNQATLNNNFRDLADKINQLRTALVNLGLVG